MRHLFIINPAAGKKETTALLEKKLAALSVDHEVVYTKGAGDARIIARQAAERGDPVRIYACRFHFRGWRRGSSDPLD